ncbi:MAG: DUF4333 domain-containing protein [Proteobacteria bacterium]|nr:DUF4333 domain-containing protein [Pseudomonadota bacterium]
MSPSVPWFALAVALWALGFGPGCEDRKLDLRNVEAIAKDRYESQSGVSVTKVTCPEQVPTRKGYDFDCTVAFEGGVTMAMTVEQLGGTNLRWSPTKPVTWLKDVKAAVAKKFAREGRTIGQLICPKQVYLHPGDSVTCWAGDIAGQSISVEYALSADGGESIRLVPGPIPD